MLEDPSDKNERLSAAAFEANIREEIRKRVRETNERLTRDTDEFETRHKRVVRSTAVLWLLLIAGTAIWTWFQLNQANRQLADLTNKIQADDKELGDIKDAANASVQTAQKSIDAAVQQLNKSNDALSAKVTQLGVDIKTCQDQIAALQKQMGKSARDTSNPLPDSRNLNDRKVEPTTRDFSQLTQQNHESQ